MNAHHSSRLVRVLVADDSAFMRNALTRMIEADPALRVSGTAHTGPETLEKICLLQPDVVILDVEMPGLGGLEILRGIMRDFPRPVIVISSLTQEAQGSLWKRWPAGLSTMSLDSYLRCHLTSRIIART